VILDALLHRDDRAVGAADAADYTSTSTMFRQ
jgi:hypothetical protein